MLFDEIYYETDVLNYTLGKELKEQFKDLPWHQIESHNRIEEMQKKENKEFPKMKRHLIIGVRKTHKYTENKKVSDYLVPFTSSGCTAMCLYCYLVCNYNKCAYLRLFVNREQMLEKLLKTDHKAAKKLTFEIGSNSDLILENTITRNLEWVISEFGKNGSGNITFPTKFDMVDSLLPLDHQGKTIFRMSLNPESIIQKIELKTSSLTKRIEAVNKMCEAGYPTGILIAPVILENNWLEEYSRLFDIMAETLTAKVKKQLVLEVILMTYSYVHRAINAEAFPNSQELYNKELMTGRGMGRYCYRSDVRSDAELFLRDQIAKKLPEATLLYIS